MTSWRTDMENAPKDGTMLLGHEDGDFYGITWSADTASWSSHCGQYVTVTPEPTHWMPLPPPPQEKGHE